MELKVILKREIKRLLVSRRFIIYLVVIFLPVILGAAFSYWMHKDPSMLAKMTAFMPNPITEVTPAVGMMIFADSFAFPVAIIAILQGGDFIAGDQARGMLQLLVSKPLRRRDIVLGKYLNFAAIFIPLILLSTVIEMLLIRAMGIGTVTGMVFLSYLIYFIILGMVYLSIATFFSSTTKTAITAIVTAFIFMIVWTMFDALIPYLPQHVADVVKLFSLTHYANNILSYISGGEALLFIAGGVSASVSLADYLTAWAVIALLIVAPVLLATVILQRRDIPISQF